MHKHLRVNIFDVIPFIAIPVEKVIIKKFVFLRNTGYACEYGIATRSNYYDSKFVKNLMNWNRKT